MTLYETIDLLKKIALKHPNIGSASEGNIYEYMNANPSVKYGVFFITQGTHSQDEMFNHFEFTLFYVDRLVDDMEENRLQIQSIGKEILSNILTFFCEEFDAECDNITYQPFTQKFVDMTAGIYSTITIDIPKDVICPEEYWKEDWKTPVIVIRNQDKRVVFTENGTYTIDYDPNTYTGLGTVEVNVNIDVDSYYNNGYNQGKTDGISEQKSKLESINITENGTYTKEDGYSHIEVNVPDLNGSYDEGYAEGERVGYGQGKTDGVNEQKGKLSQIRISENGTYTKEDGYSEVVVDVPDLNGDYNEGYEQGKTDGVNEQKSKLESISITENGTYSREDGYNQIVVEVPDLNGSYDEGYGQGKTDGINEQKSKLESISITENGVYSKEDGYNHIEVNVPDLNGSYDEGYQQGHTEGYAEGERIGYAQGKTDGVNEQKGKLSQITISENGTYTNENGYSHIEVNVPDLNGSYDEGYQKGKTDGVNEQKGKLSQITISENGTYTKEDGYNEVVVNVPDLNGDYNEGYVQGKTDGVNEQKSKLETINITKNGTYTKEDGYNEIVVEVPDLNGSYDEGYTQGQADAVANAKALEVTENGQYGDGKTLYKTINVNVMPKINVKETGLKFGNSSFTEVPEWVDFEGVTDMYGMFQYCSRLQTIPFIDTSNVSSMSTMFAYCNRLQTIPLLNTSNVKNMYNMFYYCGNLETIPLLNTSNVTDMNSMFAYCNRLQTIPSLDTSKVTNMSNMFNDCRSLVSIPALNAQSLNMQSSYGVFGTRELPNLTDFGGFLNLKCSLTSDRNLKKLPNLTYQSCINVLNGLYDFTGNGETPNSNQGKLKVAQSFIDTVGDKISIGTSRGWTITA